MKSLAAARSSAPSVEAGLGAAPKRSFDLGRLNMLANHPSINLLGGLDLAEPVANLANHFLDGEHGAFCFCWSAPGAYEIHAMILQEGRGRWAAEFFDACRAYMIGKGARQLWARIAPDKRHVRLFARKAGFSPAGTNTIDLGSGPVTYDLFAWGTA